MELPPVSQQDAALPERQRRNHHAPCFLVVFILSLLSGYDNKFAKFAHSTYATQAKNPDALCEKRPGAAF